MNDKIQLVKQVLADLQASSTSETKSTAGDKHETALAMLQIEQANVGAQLKDLLNKKATLEKIDPALVTCKITNGSFIKTNRGYLFLSAAFGKVAIDGVTVTALSAQSPLGAKLMGLSIHGIAEINSNHYVIESIE